MTRSGAAKTLLGLALDRREMLGLLAVSPLLRACGAEPAAPRALSDAIDTVVLLMMENRSFDHYFGALSLEEGRAVDGLVAGMSNPDLAGAPVAVHPVAPRCLAADPSHGWSASRTQFADGRNDGFVQVQEKKYGAEAAPEVMGYLGRQSLPASYALADAYTVCERWFAALMTSTWPNRFYSLAAQSGGIRNNDEGATYDFFTIYDRLDVARRSWGVYYGNISFSLLLERNYPRERFHKLDLFFEHAAAGTLPNFSVVEPIYGKNDDHPPAHPVAGQVMIASIYDALARSPQWGRCLLVVVYDEHGGFFDHVPPPKAADARAGMGFDQRGFRVPALVIGPWVKERHVSATIYDHTSVLRTLENLWGMKALTDRDAAANDLLDVIDRDRMERDDPRAPATLPPITADEAVIYAPECRSSIGLARGGAVTGQPELESAYDARPWLAWADRRRDSQSTYERLMRRAEKHGLLAVQSKGL